MKREAQSQARQLRAEGHSVREICRQLGVAKSSVSYWVREIILTPEQLQRLEANNADNRQRFARTKGREEANKNRAEAEARHRQFRNAGFERARVDANFRIIAALYWGEGDKTTKTFRVTNSDPTLLNVILRWLIRNGFDDIIRFTVRYHPANGLSEGQIRDWWLQQLPGLKEKHLRAFGQWLIHRASQRKGIGKLPYGTANLEVCRTELHYNILGGIDYLRSMGDW